MWNYQSAFVWATSFISSKTQHLWDYFHFELKWFYGTCDVAGLCKNCNTFICPTQRRQRSAQFTRSTIRSTLLRGDYKDFTLGPRKVVAHLAQKDWPKHFSEDALISGWIGIFSTYKMVTYTRMELVTVSKSDCIVLMLTPLTIRLLFYHLLRAWTFFKLQKNSSSLSSRLVRPTPNLRAQTLFFARTLSELSSRSVSALNVLAKFMFRGPWSRLTKK